MEMNSKLSSRLLAIIKYVDPSDIVIDVGSDHGQLAIELARSNAAQRVLASENKRGPFKTLAAAVKHSQLTNLNVMLTDGLNNIPTDINTVIIAGMGGVTINEIISRKNAPITQIKKLILLPHGGAPLLRKTASELGFRLIAEEVIKDDDRFYELLVFVPGSITYTSDELLFGPINLLKQSPNFRLMWENVYEENEYILAKPLNPKRRKEIEALQERIKTL